jgi:hypothetical protein
MNDFNCVYGGISFSILSRVVFIILLYINKSQKILSCTVCGLNVVSNSFWLPYAWSISSQPLLIRSGIDCVLSFWGMMYILYNRYTSITNHATDVSPQCFCMIYSSKGTLCERDKQRVDEEDGGIRTRMGV